MPQSDDEFRSASIAALEAGDWHGSYVWAKAWIMGGAGAWLLDPWLLYAASALLHGQPRIAVHSLDLALTHWIDNETDRALLLWARGAIIRRRLSDPKTALADLKAAVVDAPSWLRETAARDAEECASEGGASRKRKPSVGPAPAFAGPSSLAEKLPARRPGGLAGLRPSVWDALLRQL